MFRLESYDGRLQLLPDDTQQGGALFIDLPAYYASYQRENIGIKQDLAKAVGCKPGVRPRVLDATAGLLSDASLLAYLGCEVDLLEQHTVVYALIEDALKRAKAEGVLVGQLLLLPQQSAQSYLRSDAAQKASYDSIYLDPMFPLRQKSAKVKKGMQYLHQLVGISEAQEESDLLRAARYCALKRVVVKRPRLANFLAEEKPHFQISGKQIRYDIYLPLT